MDNNFNEYLRSSEAPESQIKSNKMKIPHTNHLIRDSLTTEVIKALGRYFNDNFDKIQKFRFCYHDNLIVHNKEF